MKEVLLARKSELCPQFASFGEYSDLTLIFT